MNMNEEFMQKYIKAFRAEGVIPSLLLRGIYKLATNPKYDLEEESQIYKTFLKEKNIDTSRGFRDYFMDVMTGKDPIIQALSIGAGSEILKEDGTFISETLRGVVARDGRAARYLSPKSP